MRDNAGENKSQEVIYFFESMGVKNYYNTVHEQWQNGLPEAAINSVMMLSRRIMVESGLCRRVGGRFWFKSALAGCAAQNVTYKARIRTSLVYWHSTHATWGNRHPSILIARPTITKTLCLVKTSKTELRHITRSIADSWNEKHSKSSAQRKVLKYMIL